MFLQKFFDKYPKKSFKHNVCKNFDIFEKNEVSFDLIEMK